MPKPCEDCAMARENPHYTRFDPLCLWCGARLIQRIGELPRPRQELSERRRKVLADWVAHGHNEMDIRRLVAGPPALQPASDAPTSTKPHSARKKSNSGSGAA